MKDRLIVVICIVVIFVCGGLLVRTTMAAVECRERGGLPVRVMFQIVPECVMGGLK